MSYALLEAGGPRGTIALSHEVVGTFFLSLALFVGGDGWKTWNALAPGAMLTCLTWMGVSGDFNAALTVSNMLAVGRKAKPAASYTAGGMALLGQLIGSTLAALFTTFVGDGAPAAPSGGDTASALSDAFITLVLIYGSSSGAGGYGISYFSALSAFSSIFGANPSVVVGAVVGNFVHGTVLGTIDVIGTLRGGIPVGKDCMLPLNRDGCSAMLGVACAIGAPLVAGAIFPYLKYAMCKLPRWVVEVLGTFLFALMSFGIGFDNPVAIGTSLYVISNAFPMKTFNPAITLASFIERGCDLQVWADPIIDILAQVTGVTLAAVVAPYAGLSTTVPRAASIGPSAVLELLFSFVFASVYLASPANITKGLAYFSCLTSFHSTFNPAFPIGVYLKNLITDLAATVNERGSGESGSGEPIVLDPTDILGPTLGPNFGGILAPTAIIAPVLGGVLAALAFEKYIELNEAFGSFFLSLTVSFNAPCAAGLSSLAVGGMVASLLTIYSRECYFNPVLSLYFSNPCNGGELKISQLTLQVVGSVVGACVATLAGVADGAASPRGLPGNINSAFAEIFLAAFLSHLWRKDEEGNGLKYCALLGVFGSAAGSIANPAITYGAWIGNGIFGNDIIGSGFDFTDVDGLIALAGHIVCPLAGAIIASPAVGLFARIPDIFMLDKVKLSNEEFFASFLLVLGASVLDSSSGVSVFTYGLFVNTVFDMYPSADGFAFLSAYEAFDRKAKGNVFTKKLVAQILGALVAVYTASFLVSGSTGGTGDAGLSDTLRNGLLLGLFLVWGMKSCTSFLGIPFVYFVGVTLFASVNPNSAVVLSSAIKAAIDTGDASGFNTVWLAAFLAPIAGGALARQLEPVMRFNQV